MSLGFPKGGALGNKPVCLPPFWKCRLPWKRMGDRGLDCFGPKGDTLGGNRRSVGKAQSREGPFQLSESLTSTGNFLPGLIISPVPFISETVLYFTSDWDTRKDVS